MRKKYLIIHMMIVSHVSSLILPESPCSNIFKYINDDGIVYGDLNLNVEAGTSEIDVEIKMTFRTAKESYIEINRIYDNLKTDNIMRYGGVLPFRVDFKQLSTVANLTHVIYNRKTICINNYNDSFSLKQVTRKKHIFLRNTPTKKPITTTRKSITTTRKSITTTMKSITTTTKIPRTKRKPIVSTNNLPESSSHDYRVVKKKECGYPKVSIKNNVAGKIDINSWPWLVNLMHKVSNNWELFCLGVLIPNNYILTAANCVEDKIPSDIVIILGSNNPHLRGEGIEDIKRKVREIYKNNNIAILKLTVSNIDKAEIVPICLPNKLKYTFDLNIPGKIVRWDNCTEKLHYSDVSIIFNKKTCKVLDRNRTFICGESNSLNCQKNYGGIGFVQEIESRYYLFGISYNVLNNKQNTIQKQYTYIKPYVTWIENTIKGR